MKDAVGGSILFYIILGFLAVFIVFIAIIMNYAAAYRTNNYVVTLIEQNEGKYPFGNSGDTRPSTLVGYLRSNSYYNGLDITCAQNANGAVYHVVTYVRFDIPVLDLVMKLPIQNDTKTIFKSECYTETTNSWNGG